MAGTTTKKAAAKKTAKKSAKVAKKALKRMRDLNLGAVRAKLRELKRSSAVS